VAAVIDPEERRVRLLGALSVRLITALDSLQLQLLEECHDRDDAARLVHLAVDGSGDLATYELRTDGGILAPAERIDEATRHVADGCWIYAGTGVREDGLRLFWIGGPR